MTTFTSVQPSALIMGDGTLALALEMRLSQEFRGVIRAGKDHGSWHLDLARDPSCWRVPAHPVWVFVCAGVTSRKDCEDHPFNSRQINVKGGMVVARYFSGQGSKVVFFGTDLGREDGEYARQKEDLRAMVRGLPGVFWIRLGKVIHCHLPVLRLWREQAYSGEVEAWGDVRIRPITPEAVAEVCAALMKTKEFLPKEMDWNQTPPISYAELASRWAQATGTFGKVTVRSTSSPQKYFEMPAGTCPESFQRVLARENRKAWWFR
jgi:dTDP-4-dehydrorhamnose reductase